MPGEYVSTKMVQISAYVDYVVLISRIYKLWKNHSYSTINRTDN